MEDRRVREHPILGIQEENFVEITVDGQTLRAKEGETIAAALLANGIQIHRYTAKKHEPRGIFCGIGQCTDCVMTVDGNPVRAGMTIETQQGYGKLGTGR